MPERIQLSRRKGWRMPPNTVSVARPTMWGNPWRVRELLPELRDEYGDEVTEDDARLSAVDSFRAWLTGPEGIDWSYPGTPRARVAILAHLSDLRGHDLACWCPLDQPCHADVLLELANAPLSCEAA